MQFFYTTLIEFIFRMICSLNYNTSDELSALHVVMQKKKKLFSDRVFFFLIWHKYQYTS